MSPGSLVTYCGDAWDVPLTAQPGPSHALQRGIVGYARHALYIVLAVSVSGGVCEALVADLRMGIIGWICASHLDELQ